MQREETNKAILAVFVIVIVMMIVGIITADTSDVYLWKWAFAKRTPPHAPLTVPLNINMGLRRSKIDYGSGRPSPSYQLSGGGAPPQYANIQAGTTQPPAPQGRVPGEGNWLGMEIEGLSPGTIRELRLPQDMTGVIVDSAPLGSTAEKAGLLNDDVIQAINGWPVVNMADFLKATRNQKLKSATLRINRDGQILNIQVPRENTAVSVGLAGQQSWVNTPSSGTGVDTYTSASPRRSGSYNNTSIPPIAVNSPMPHVFWGVCEKCHTIIPNGGVRLYPPTYSLVGRMNAGNYSLPTPVQQQASRKVQVEGHWLGMELIPITPELARAYNLPPGVAGLLVDEVTLEAAESGLLAGDVVQSINNMSFGTLRDFQLATRRIESLPAVRLGILRNGRPASVTLRSNWGKVGVAQNEAAQPIKPGALSPHKEMGRACTDCHIIMKNGGQLPTDEGDILPSPPPITLNSNAPHTYRGQCNNCHTIVR